MFQRKTIAHCTCHIPWNHRINPLKEQQTAKRFRASKCNEKSFKKILFFTLYHFGFFLLFFFGLMLLLRYYSWHLAFGFRFWTRNDAFTLLFNDIGVPCTVYRMCHMYLIMCIIVYVSTVFIFIFTISLS